MNSRNQARKLVVKLKPLSKEDIANSTMQLKDIVSRNAQSKQTDEQLHDRRITRSMAQNISDSTTMSNNVNSKGKKRQSDIRSENYRKLNKKLKLNDESSKEMSETQEVESRSTTELHAGGSSPVLMPITSSIKDYFMF